MDKRKWGLVFLVISVIVAGYFLLGSLKIIPAYRCGSTMGPNGVVNWCGWIK